MERCQIFDALAGQPIDKPQRLFILIDLERLDTVDKGL